MTIDQLTKQLSDNISSLGRRQGALRHIPAHQHDIVYDGDILLEELREYVQGKNNKRDLLKEDLLDHINDSMVKLLHVSKDLNSDRYWGLIAGEGGKAANTEQFFAGLFYIDALVETAFAIKAFKKGLYTDWKKTLRSQAELGLGACDKKVAKEIFEKEKENLAEEPYNFKSLPHKLGKEQLEQLREPVYAEIQGIRHEFFMKYDKAHKKRSEKLG